MYLFTMTYIGFCEEISTVNTPIWPGPKIAPQPRNQCTDFSAGTFPARGRGWVSSALPGETPEEGFGEGTGTRTSPGALEEDQGFQHLVFSRIGRQVGRKFPFCGQCCELSHRKYGWIFKPWTLSFALRKFCDLSGVAVYEMGAIVFSSFSSLSPALLPVYFSHYMFVQYLAQWDPVLVQALGELHNTKVVLMREIINLSKRKRILVIFVGIPIMTSSERLNPRWLMEQRKVFHSWPPNMLCFVFYF